MRFLTRLAIVASLSLPAAPAFAIGSHEMPARMPTTKFASPIRQTTCITDGYGARRRRPKAGASLFHEAADLRAQCGTPVFAAGDGVVMFAGWNRGYGNQVQIRHADGTQTRYSHLSSISRGLRPGSQVTTATQIARSGNTTSIRGGLPCHLHFELLARRRDGTFGKVNPELILRQHFCNGVTRKPGDSLGGRFIRP